MKNKRIYLSGELGKRSDFKHRLKRYARNWYLFAISLALCLTLGYLYLRYATPIYAIKSKILVKDKEKGPGALDASDAFLDMNLFPGNQNIKNEVEVFKGKGLMARVMRELDLQATYYTQGPVKTIELYGESLPLKLVPSALNTKANGTEIRITPLSAQEFRLEDVDGTLRESFGNLIKRSYGSFTIVAHTQSTNAYPYVDIRLHDAHVIGDSYAARVMITPVDKDASVLNIYLEDAVPEKGVDILEKLIELYNREAIEDKNQIAENTLQFIDERLGRLVNDLSAVEKNVEDYKKRHNISDVSIEAQNYVEEASEYSRKMAQYETQISVLESLQQYLKGSRENELIPGSMGIEDPALIRLTTRYNELQLEKQRLLRSQTEANPLVQAINDQISNLRGNIWENLGNIKKSLIINRNNLSANTGQYRARVSTVPTIERNLLEIQRQQGIKETLYSYLLQKREEAAISLASAVSNLRVIDKARSGRFPISPKRLLVGLGACLLGLIFPVVFLYIKDTFNERIQYASDVERNTTIPILGEITHNHTKDFLVFNGTARTEISEIFRLLRSNLKYAFPSVKKQIILVTSSMTSEGKTFVSTNLGASLAILGKQAVVLEFDLRLPKLLKSLDMPEDLPGIADYLSNPDTPVTHYVKPVQKVKGLHVLPAGTLPPNPSELLVNERVNDLFNALQEAYDYVIVDTSPIGQVADAFALSEYAHLVLYIVRYQYTYKQQLNIINDIETHQKFDHVMLVLNDAKKHNGYGYGYGYSKGYGYGK